MVLPEAPDVAPIGIGVAVPKTSLHCIVPSQSHSYPAWNGVPNNRAVIQMLPYQADICNWRLLNGLLYRFSLMETRCWCAYERQGPQGQSTWLATSNNHTGTWLAYPPRSPMGSVENTHKNCCTLHCVPDACILPILNRQRRAARLHKVTNGLGWRASNWEQDLFTDESWFCLFHGDARTRMWHRREECYAEQDQWVSESVMVLSIYGWFQIHSHGRNGTLNVQSYEDKVIQPEVLSYVQGHGHAFRLPSLNLPHTELPNIKCSPYTSVASIVAQHVYHRAPGSAFIKRDQLDPWIKDQLRNALLSTILSLQIPNFVSCGRACPSHMTQNLVNVGAKLWTADRFIVDHWSMDYADPVW